MAKKKIHKDPVCNVGYFKRFFAYLVDYYFGLLLCSLPIVLMNGIINRSEKMQMNLFFFKSQPILLYGVAIVSLVLGYCYYIYIPLHKWKGQTLGKRLFHFKIVKNDGNDIDFKTILLRHVLGMLVIEGALISCSSVIRQLLTFMTGLNFVDPLMKIGVYVSLVSCILIFITKNHKMIHDLISGTIVTNESYQK